jgi:hypothetical protein
MILFPFNFYGHFENLKQTSLKGSLSNFGNGKKPMLWGPYMSAQKIVIPLTLSVVWAFKVIFVFLMTAYEPNKVLY